MATKNKKEEEVNIFSDPDKIDALVKTRLDQFPRRGGSLPPRMVRWSESELAIIDYVIWTYITEQGLSREATAQQIHNRWGISLSTARRYITDSIKRAATKFPAEDIEEKRQRFLERCESILQMAIEDGQKDTALRALDTYAKAAGLYKETKDINLEGNTTVRFDFQ